MGIYLNPPVDAFEAILREKIYVDKSGLISYTNSVLNSSRMLTCFSRPRRFGKSYAAKMLAAYYSKGADSDSLFQGLEISNTDTYRNYLNKYNVLFLDIAWFISIASNIEKTVTEMQENIIEELKETFPDMIGKSVHSLPVALLQISARTGQKFFIIIDEWDVLIRDEAANQKVQEEYINFLRGMFKGTEPTKYIQLAYLTGILPIKREKTQSALNNFDEFTMLSPSILAKYIGFTEDEVQKLAEEYHQNFEEVKRWYDGYLLKDYQVYNPRAVISLMQKGEFKSYWSETASYEAIVSLINMDYDGLKTAIIEMLSGAAVKVNTATFKNDILNIQSKDDVLTYMIHLGYLGYDQTRKMAFVPNEDIRQELEIALDSKIMNK